MNWSRFRPLAFGTVLIGLLAGCDVPSPTGLRWTSEEVKVGMTLEEVEKKLDRWPAKISGLIEFDDNGEAKPFTEGVMVWQGRADDNEEGDFVEVTFRDGKVTAKRIVTAEEAAKEKSGDSTK
jgi:hypothetical protein